MRRSLHRFYAPRHCACFDCKVESRIRALAIELRVAP